MLSGTSADRFRAARRRSVVSISVSSAAFPRTDASACSMVTSAPLNSAGVPANVARSRSSPGASAAVRAANASVAPTRLSVAGAARSTGA
ncbi:hypothetical protein HGB48_08420 [Actinomadura latina]|uniref:Uncharacterized protein n=1 Tax=Actinomadura latina TaxID=163603 RepID=A0A846YTS1_9ACTN|nr:hypothetical protein [Actinomadura latina]